MHEMGIALEIIDIAINSIPKDLKNSKVKKINVKLGKLSAVTPENLKFCFDVASKDGILEGAELSLEIVEVTVECRVCGFKSIIHEPLFKCERCDSESVSILSGRELDMYSIEIEKE